MKFYKKITNKKGVINKILKFYLNIKEKQVVVYKTNHTTLYTLNAFQYYIEKALKNKAF